MADLSYAYVYFVTGSVPGNVSLGGRYANTMNPVVENDGNINNVTYSGEGIRMGTSTGIFQGLSAAGDPIIKHATASVQWLFSNDYTLANQTISTSSSALYFCFLAGSQIATPFGETNVEELKIGDHVRCADGRSVPVRWVGYQTVSTRFASPERLMPVRFAAGSLGSGLPHTHLTVTADHAMLIDGVLCQAGALVNGTTITRVPLSQMGEKFVVYHIETEAHEIILANGAPAETFIDNVSRRAFDNYAEFESLYGDVPEIEEMAYPRAMSARQVPQRIKASLASNAVSALGDQMGLQKAI